MLLAPFLNQKITLDKAEFVAADGDKEQIELSLFGMVGTKDGPKPKIWDPPPKPKTAPKSPVEKETASARSPAKNDHDANSPRANHTQVNPTTEPGFTGEMKDKLGRTMCFNEGKRVPCSGNDEPPQGPEAKLTDPEKQPEQGKEEVPEEQVGKEQQFAEDWAKVSAGEIDKVEASDASDHDYTPQEVAAEQDWHGQYVEWRKKGGPLDSPANVMRFISGLLNPKVGTKEHIQKLAQGLEVEGAGTDLGGGEKIASKEEREEDIAKGPKGQKGRWRFKSNAAENISGFLEGLLGPDLVQPVSQVLARLFGVYAVPIAKALKEKKTKTKEPEKEKAPEGDWSGDDEETVKKRQKFGKKNVKNYLAGITDDERDELEKEYRDWATLNSQATSTEGFNEYVAGMLANSAKEVSLKDRVPPQAVRQEIEKNPSYKEKWEDKERRRLIQISRGKKRGERIAAMSPQEKKEREEKIQARKKEKDVKRIEKAQAARRRINRELKAKGEPPKFTPEETGEQGKVEEQKKKEQEKARKVKEREEQKVARGKQREEEKTKKQKDKEELRRLQKIAKEAAPKISKKSLPYQVKGSICPSCPKCPVCGSDEVVEANEGHNYLCYACEAFFDGPRTKDVSRPNEPNRHKVEIVEGLFARTKSLKKGTCKRGQNPKRDGCVSAQPEAPKVKPSKLENEGEDQSSAMMRLMQEKMQANKDKIARLRMGGTEQGNDEAKKAMDQISNFLGMGVALGTNELASYSKDSKYHDPVSYVLGKGEKFYGSERPSDVEMGTPQDCYKNASLLVIGSSKLRYVEGFAMRQGLMPVMHGWAIDEQGKVIDNTWEDPENSAYIGVVYDRDKYLKRLYKSKFYGVLGGSDKGAVEALRKGGI